MNASQSVAQSLVIRGQLVDENGAPAAGSVTLHPTEEFYDLADRLTADRERPQLARSRTNARGLFTLRLENQRAGDFVWVQAVPDSSAPGKHGIAEILVPLSDQRVDLPRLNVDDFRNQRTVRLTNSQNETFPGVEVGLRSGRPSVRRGIPQWRSGLLVATIRTDGKIDTPATGRLLIAGTPAQDRRRRGRPTGTVNVEWSLQDQNTNWTIDVRTGNGLPVSGGLVLWSADAPPIATTDERGMARFAAPPSGRVLVVSPNGDSSEVDLGRSNPSRTVKVELEAPIPLSFDAPTKPAEVHIAILGPLGSVKAVTEPVTRWPAALTSSPHAILLTSVGKLPTVQELKLAEFSNASHARKVPVPALVDAWTFFGRVIDGDKTEPPRQSLAAVAASDRGCFGYADDQGVVAIPWLTGVESATFKAAGFAAQKFDISPSADRSQQKPEIIAMHRGATGLGTVQDSAGAPIADAQIAIHVTRGPRVPDFGAESDADGRFVVPGLPKATIELKVQASGFAPATIRGIDLASQIGTTDIGTITLQPGYELSARIVDDEDEGIEGVRVLIGVAAGLRRLGVEGKPMRISRNERIVLHDLGIQSDADGFFRIPDLLPEERLDLILEHPGFLKKEARVQLPIEDSLVFRLESGHRVAGQVVDPLGNPIEGARLVLARPGGFVGRKFSDSDGAFAFETVAAGRYTFRASAAGWASSPSPEELEVSHVKPGLLKIEMQVGAAVEGTVFDSDGLPLAGARVWTAGKNDSTGSDGSFRLEGVEIGPTTLHAVSSTGAQAELEAEVAPGFQRFDLRIERGIDLSGVVVHEDGSPAVGAAVIVNRWLHAIADSNGDFIFLDFSRPSGQLVASLGELRSERVEFDLNQQMSGYRLVLNSSATGVIDGQVSGLSEDQLAQVEITASSHGARRRARPGYDGSFEFRGLAAGTWFVTAALPQGNQSVRTEVKIYAGEASNAFLDFGEASSSLTVLTTLGGTPSDGITLTLTGGDPARRVSGRPDYRGMTRFEGLSDGVYQVQGRGPFIVRSRQVDVRGESDFIVALQPARLIVSTTAQPGRTQGRGLEAVLIDEFGRSTTRGLNSATGTFTFDAETGSYTLAIRREEQVLQRVPVVIPPGGASLSVDLQNAAEPDEG